MTLSIIVVNFRNPALLRLCLKSIERSLEPSFSHEIIVVDSQSSLDTQNIVNEEFPKARLIPFKENIGYTKGVNEGIKASEGDYILILNPDIVPTKDSIEELTRYMTVNSGTGLVGPQLLNFDGTPQDSCFKFYNPSIVLYRRTCLGRLPFGKKSLNEFLMKNIGLNSTTNVDWISGSAMMVSKKAIDKVGLLDESLFLYMSDVDWARRFWENGFKVIYHPSARMYHYHRRSSKGRFGLLDAVIKKETRWHIKDGFRYFSKYGFFKEAHFNI